MAERRVDAEHCIGSRSNSSNYNWLFELETVSARPIFEGERCTIATLADDCSFVIAIAFVVNQDLVLVQHVSMITAHRPYRAMAFQVFPCMIKTRI